MSDILILPVASASLAFGLDWLPLLDGRADRMAYRVARRHRASHLVAAGSFAAAVGLAHLSPRGTGRGAPLHSAAQNMARLFPAGTVALLMALDESCHWLVAVHEGTVVARTDKIHACADDARESLEELRQAFPQLMLLDESQAPSLRDIAAASGEPANHLTSSAKTRCAEFHSGVAGSAPAAPDPLPCGSIRVVIPLLLVRRRVRSHDGCPDSVPHTHVPHQRVHAEPRQEPRREQIEHPQNTLPAVESALLRRRPIEPELSAQLGRQVAERHEQIGRAHV